VEERTGIPNGHLSQIERGQIKRPDQRILWKLAELYDLNFGLLAIWAGSSEEISDERAAYLDAVVRFLRDLGGDDLRKVMLYVEGLAHPGGGKRAEMKAARPRLGTGRSKDGGAARELAGDPVAREPK
jgi:transcriptional regulator with XRE-family HTH domain